MNERFLRGVVAVSVCLAPIQVGLLRAQTNTCNPDPFRCLPVALVKQTGDNWCWAAAGEMILSSLKTTNTNIAQCEQANLRFDRHDCCRTPKPEECDTTGWPQFDSYGFSSAQTTNQALTWEQVQEQVYCRGQPFAASWYSKDINGAKTKVGHMVVIFGYETINGVNYVMVNDPKGDQYVMDYQDYRDGDDTHDHWRDYYNFTPADPNAPRMVYVNLSAESRTNPSTNGPVRLKPTRIEGLPRASLMRKVDKPWIQFRKTGLRSYRYMGFRSQEEMQTSVVTNVFPVLAVDLGDLISFQKETNAVALLRSTPRVISLLAAGTQLRGCEIQVHEGDAFRPAAIGLSNFAAQLNDALEKSSATNHLPIESHFVVELPDIMPNPRFVACTNASSQLILTPLADHRRLGFTAGRSLPAEAVFLKLAEEARNAEGLY